MAKNKKKTIRISLAILAIIILTLVFCRNDWALTRIAELAASYKLKHKTKIELFRNDGACYHINYLRVFNRDEFQHIPMMSFQNVFLKSSSGFYRTINYDSVECYGGELLIIVLPDGSTNFNNFPLLMPNNISLNNLRVRINDSSLKPESEYNLVINGQLERNPDKSIKNIAMKLFNREGQLLANIVTNPEFDSNNPEPTNLPYIIRDFNLADILKVKDSALILKYYPAIISLVNHFSNNSNE